MESWMECWRCCAGIDNPGDNSVQFITCTCCGARNASISFSENSGPCACLEVPHCGACGAPVKDPSNPVCITCNRPVCMRYDFRFGTMDVEKQNATLAAADFPFIGTEDCDDEKIAQSESREASLDPDFKPSKPDEPESESDEPESESGNELDDAEALAKQQKQQKQSGNKRARDGGERNVGQRGKRRANVIVKERGDLAASVTNGGKQKGVPVRVMGQVRGSAKEECVESESERAEIVQGLEDTYDFDDHGCRDSQKAMMKMVMIRMGARYGSEDGRNGSVRADGIVNTYPKFAAQMWDPPEGIFTGRGSKKIEVTHDHELVPFKGEFDSVNDFQYDKDTNTANRDRAVAYCTRIAETEARRAGEGGGKK
eukprot:7379370-Prymnesium_polylepis.1